MKHEHHTHTFTFQLVPCGTTEADKIQEILNKIWCLIFFLSLSPLCPSQFWPASSTKHYLKGKELQQLWSNAGYTLSRGGKLKEKGRTCAWPELILFKVWQTETPDPDVLSAAFAVSIWPHLSCQPGWHLGWTMCPPAADVTDFADDGSAAGAGPGARLSCQGLPLLCWVLPYILKALLNRLVGIHWKEQSKMGTCLCLWNATPFVARLLPNGHSASSPLVWVTPSLIHWAAADCKWVNLSPFLLPCGNDAPDRSQGSACTKPFVTPQFYSFSLFIFNWLSPWQH